MEELTHAFAPTGDGLKFFSEEQGLRYARGADFEVEGNIASREDMPGVSFFLLRQVDGWYWVRR